MADHLRLEIDNTGAEPHSLRRKQGGEPPGGDDMDARVRELEKGHAIMIERLGALDRRVDDGFKSVNTRLDDLNKKIDKLPNEWAMARVVFYVTAALMAAAFFGPRLAAMLQPTV